MSKFVKIFILLTIMLFILINVTFATSLNLITEISQQNEIDSINTNILTSTNEVEQNFVTTTYNNSYTSQPEQTSYQINALSSLPEADLGLSNILSILLIVVGVILILLGIAILIRLKG